MLSRVSEKYLPGYILQALHTKDKGKISKFCCGTLIQERPSPYPQSKKYWKIQIVLFIQRGKDSG